MPSERREKFKNHHGATGLLSTLPWSLTEAEVIRKEKEYQASRGLGRPETRYASKAKLANTIVSLIMSLLSFKLTIGDTILKK